MISVDVGRCDVKLVRRQGRKELFLVVEAYVSGPPARPGMPNHPWVRISPQYSVFGPTTMTVEAFRLTIFETLSMPI